MASPTVSSPSSAPDNGASDVASPSSAPDNGASDVAAAAVAAATRTSLGLSASTQNTQKRAGDLWNYFAVHTGAPKYLDINERNMAGELLNYYFSKQVLEAVSCPIPHNCDANLKPTTNTKKILAFPTLSTYFGQWGMSLRERLPNHPYLPSRKGDPWDFCKTTFDGALAVYTRNLKVWEHDPELEFGKQIVYPLYANKTPYPPGVRHFFDSKEKREEDYTYNTWLRMMDIEQDSSVISELHFASPSLERIIDMRYLLEQCFTKVKPDDPEFGILGYKLLICYANICRPGETRWMSFDDYTPLPHIGATGIPHFQSKTFRSHDNIVVASSSDPFFCHFTMLAFAILTGNLLKRGREEEINNSVNHVFPKDLTMSQDSNARALQRSMKKLLPKDTPTHILEGITGKSMRAGAITDCILHPSTNSHDITARSGHKPTGTNADHYVEDNIYRTFRCANVLAQNTDIDNLIVPPCFNDVSVGWLPSVKKMLGFFLEGQSNIFKDCH